MVEALGVLGHAHDAVTGRMARMLVDHALAYGWDADLGGFYREGTTYGKPEEKLKDWWVEVEGLNALLLMHQKYGAKSHSHFNAFQLQSTLILHYQINSQLHPFTPNPTPDS